LSDRHKTIVDLAAGWPYRRNPATTPRADNGREQSQQIFNTGIGQRLR
jgi:hypothetical protein